MNEVPFPRNDCHESLLFDVHGHLVAVKGEVCIFCNTAVRKGLTGYICMNPKCPTYSAPMNRVRNMYYLCDENEAKK